MAEETRSSLWRKEGNKLFVTATDDLAPVVRMSRMQKAYNCYQNASGTAGNDAERASAAKNCGIVMWRTGRTSAQAGESWAQVKFYFKEGLKNFNIAFRTGTACHKPTHWSDNILASCRGCWEEVSALVEALPDSENNERVITIQEFIDYLPIHDMKADCFMEIADYQFHRGIQDLANENYKSCLGHMRDCHYPMHEAIMHGEGSARLQGQFDTLESDILMQSGLALSMQSREIADKLFDKVMMDEETLSTDMIWEIIDWYKDSIIKVRGLDVKNEAISLSRIGLVYERVLKIRFRAKDYLKNALELAQAITPMNVTNEKWYKDTVDMLDAFQKETLQHEQEQENKRKAAVREKLKPQTDLLDKHSSDKNIEFLKFVYENFKPKKPDHKLELGEEEPDFARTYKLLQHAVIHYHPDRINEEEHGLEAKVLFEEITKRLTNRYQNIKMAQ